MVPATSSITGAESMLFWAAWITTDLPLSAVNVLFTDKSA